MDQETQFSLEGVLFCLNRLCGSGFEVAIPSTLREWWEVWSVLTGKWRGKGPGVQSQVERRQWFQGRTWEGGHVVERLGRSVAEQPDTSLCRWLDDTAGAQTHECCCLRIHLVLGVKTFNQNHCYTMFPTPNMLENYRTEFQASLNYLTLWNFLHFEEWHKNGCKW